MSMKSELQSSTAIPLEPDDEALFAEASGSDIALGRYDLVVLVQGMNKELLRNHERYFAGAGVGDFIVPLPNGERVLFESRTGYSFINLNAEIIFPEYLPNRGGPVAPHDAKPEDAVWLKAKDAPGGKEGLYRTSNGNRIEETLLVRQLIERHIIATAAFKGTMLPIGRSMLNKALRYKINPTDATGSLICTNWRMLSKMAERNGNDYPVYDPVLVGRFGQDGGPSLEETRTAAKHRLAHKRGGDMEAMLSGPPVPPEPPAIAAPVEPKHGPIVVTSGRPTSLRTVETVIDREQAPPITEAPDGPGEFDEPIPF
jgi:hypothetical protein